TLLTDSKLPTMFWTEAIRNACYVLNRVSITSPHNKTPYALLTRNIPTVNHFKPFGCHVTILNTSDYLGKFDGKADEGYIVGYSATNQSAGTQGNTTNSVGTQDADSDSDYDEQVIIVPSYLSNSIQESQPIDTLGDKVDDSPFPTPTGVKAVLPGCIPVPTGRVPVLASVPVPTRSITVSTGGILVPAGDTTVPTDDVPVHSSNSTDSMFNGEPTTRFPCPSDLGNHNPSPGIFCSSSYDDEFDTALNNVASSMEVSPVPTKRIHTIHPQSLIIRDPTSVVQTQSIVKQNTTVEPRSVAQALEDPSWVDAMEEEMQQFKFQNVWVLVDLPLGKYAIGTKWILKNKRDARGIVVRNKARLVAQGHRQEEDIDYDEVFALVAQIEAIRLFLAFASYMGFLVYQMDVKSAFLYGTIKEENNRDIILVQVYVDDIVFGSTKKEWCDEFEALIKGEFQMSAMGELTFFLASRPDIMFAVSACSRHQVTTTTSNLESVKKIFKYLKGQSKLGLWYPKDSPFVLEAYSDSDYAGANKDRKSITGGCQFLGRRLISWQCKKQTIMATSSTVAEYVAAANCCGQYKEEHNKVGYLLKPTGSDDYHQIIDFLSESHIMYALTSNPIIFDSLVKQFWSTATIRESELGPPAILATIDKTPYTITEALVRSRLQLADDGGVVDLPILQIYSGMDNLGYVTEGKLTFFKNKFLPQWRFLVHNLLHCLSTKSESWDQFGSPIAISLNCLFDGSRFNWSNYIFRGMVNNIKNVVKEKQENDKIGTKPDKNGKRRKARQCRRPITVKKAEKRRKYKVQGTKDANPESCINSR
nr:hypothetical protein [Tanacetum cinerariifolium]